MDLGSAMLSAEMALELLPDERRELVLLTEAPFVEGAVAAAAKRAGVSARDFELAHRIDAIARSVLH